MNHILEAFIKGRLDGVESLAEKQTDVKKVDAEVKGILAILEPKLNRELFLDLESAINGMLQVGIETGYKIGIADGSILLNDLRVLSEGVTKHYE